MSSPASLTVRVLKRLPVLASIVALAVAALVFVGWSLNIPMLTSMLPWAAPTLPPTAIGIAAGGVSLATARRNSWLARSIAIGAAVVMAAIALLVFGAHELPGGEAIERWTYGGGHAPEHLRVPINTAIAFVALAGGLITLTLRRFDQLRTPQFFAAFALVIAFVAFVGYAFGVTGLYRPARAVGMTPWTVVAIHALSLGVIFARTNVGFPALLTDPSGGGRLARRLLPAAIVIPFIVTWVVDRFERAGYYGPELGISLVTVLTVIALVWITARGARVVQRADLARAQIFAREQHEREVAQQALIAAETASSAKSDFLAVMSHELRTPLTAIIGYEELLHDEITGPVNAQQAQQLTRIKASAQHLLGLIDEILTFSRLEAGRETIRKELVDVNRVVEEAASLVAPLAAEKKLGFAVYPLEPARMIRTDAVKVRQILVNLLSNAVKFTSEGSVTLTADIEGSELAIRVRDTGAGIAPENLERAFEPFWQAEQKVTRRGTGTGLGLTVTRRLARLLGGDVEVKSEVGAGTTFTAKLPGLLPLVSTDVLVPASAPEPQPQV